VSDPLKNIIESAGFEDVACDVPVSCYSLPLTFRAFHALRALDHGLIGTPDYLGIAYFWAHEYKFYLREATQKQRKIVHDLFLKAGLALDGVSPEHAAIVEKQLGKRLKKVYG